MTLPYERSLAVVETRKFLEQVFADPTVHESLREQANRLLRHYPTERDVLQVGRLENVLYGLSAGTALPTEAVVSLPVFGGRLDWD